MSHLTHRSILITDNTIRHANIFINFNLYASYHEPQNTQQTTGDKTAQTGFNERAIHKARVGHLNTRPS